MSTIVNFNGQTMIVATNQSPPYTFLEKNITTNEWHYTSGIEVQMLKVLSRHFNFTYKLINCANDWGNLLDNGQWTGIVGNVLRKEADFGMGGMSITESRSRAVFFPNTYLFSAVTFITPPPGLKPQVFLVLQPFTLLLWISIIIALVLFLFSHWFFAERILKRKELKMYWAIIAALLRQGEINKFPSHDSLKISYAFWLFACLTITSSYGSYLFSLMTLPSHKPTIDTIYDLAKAQSSGQIQVVVTNGSVFYPIFKEAKEGIYEEIGRLLKPIESKSAGLKIVRSSSTPYSYISSRDHLTYGIILNGFHKYHLPPDSEDATFFTNIMAMAMNYEFQYKNVFNIIITNLKECGFFNFWRYREFKKLIPKYGSNSNSYHNNCGTFGDLHIEQLQSAYYLLSSGILISFVSFLIELRIRNKSFIH